MYLLSIPRSLSLSYIYMYIYVNICRHPHQCSGNSRTSSRGRSSGSSSGSRGSSGGSGGNTDEGYVPGVILTDGSNRSASFNTNGTNGTDGIQNCHDVDPNDLRDDKGGIHGRIIPGRWHLLVAVSRCKGLGPGSSTATSFWLAVDGAGLQVRGRGRGGRGRELF